MKTSILILVSSLLCAFPVKALKLAVGSSYNLPVDKDVDIRIGSKKILRAVDHGSFVTLIGQSAGKTLVHAGGKTFSVAVVPSSRLDFQKELTTFLKKTMGLHLETSESEKEGFLLNVTGTLYVFEDWKALARIAEKWDAHYRFLARPTPEALHEAENYFLKRLQGEHLGNLHLSPSLPLHVLVQTKREDLSKAKELFTPFGIEVSATSDLMELRPLVKTSVILAEVSKQASHSFGLQFPTQVEGQLLPKLQGPEQLLASLKALESKGLGKVLASPTLTCRSGAEAEFHAGGEFPIKLSGYLKQGVQWKKHGVLLKVKPKADRLGNIQLEVQMEISLLDAGQAVDGIPALKTNRVQSAFDLQSQKTIALSGLIQQTWGRSRSGLLGLSALPVLGALFGSEDFLNNKSEMVIFVTPEVVSGAQDAPLRWPEGWEQDEL